MTEAERRDFEARAIANRVPLKPSTVETSDEFYARKSAELTAQNLAKNAAKPTGLDQYYQERREVEKQSEQAQREEIAGGPYAWHGEGLSMYRNDPVAVRARWAQINPGVPFPNEGMKS